jgi:hypothetical protein
MRRNIFSRVVEDESSIGERRAILIPEQEVENEVL